MIETKFKNSEVGFIPEEWEVKPLGKVAFLKSGEAINFVTEKEGIIPCYGGNGIRAYISRFSHEGTFPIVGRQGALCGNVQLAQGKFYATEHAVVCHPNNGIDAVWLYYQLIAANLNQYNTGNAQPGLSVDRINKVAFLPVPYKKNEQSRIATALSDIDDLIATTKKLIEKKRNIKEGAMQELLSGKRRLPGFKEKWVEKEVGLTGFTYNGLSGKSKEDFGSGNSLYITFLNVLSNPVIDTSCFEKININPNERQNRAIKGDIFFNISSETPEEVGFCAYLDESIDNLYLNSFCFGFRITDPEIDGHFISYFWRSRKGRDIMTMLAQGSTRFNLSKALFKASFITIPSTKKEQKAIASVLSDMDSEIQSLESRLTKYQSLKQGMMQQLLTGKIRLI